MATNVDEFVGRRLRARRKFLGLTQEAVANKLGVTFQQIQKYEMGKNRITSSVLYELSCILKVSVGYFFEGYSAPVRKNERIEEKLLTSKEVGELVRAYEMLQNPKLKTEVTELLSAISGMHRKVEKA